MREVRKSHASGSRAGSATLHPPRRQTSAQRCTLQRRSDNVARTRSQLWEAGVDALENYRGAKRSRERGDRSTKRTAIEAGRHGFSPRSRRAQPSTWTRGLERGDEITRSLRAALPASSSRSASMRAAFATLDFDKATRWRSGPTRRNARFAPASICVPRLTRRPCVQARPVGHGRAPDRPASWS